MKYTVQILIVNVLVYLTMAYLSKHLGPAMYGELVYTLSVTSLMSFLFIFGRTELELRDHYAVGKRPNVAPLFLSIFCFVLAISFADTFYSKFDRALLILALPLGVVLIVGEYLSLFLRIKGSFSSLAIFGRPLNIFYIVLALTVGMFGRQRQIVLTIAYIIAVIYIVFLCRVAMKGASFKTSPSEVFSRRSMPFWVNSILFMFHVQAGALILGHFEMMGQLAEYSLALLVVSLGTMIFSAYFSVFLQGDFYSKWARSESLGLSFVTAGLLRAIILSAFISCAAILCISCFYPYFFDLKQYPNLRALSYSMLFVVTCRAIQSPLSMLMNVERYIAKKNLVTLVSYGCGWVGSLLLVGKYRAFGVFLGFATAELLLCLCFFWYFLMAISPCGISTSKIVADTIVDDFGKILAFARQIRRVFFREKLVVFVGYYGFGNCGDDLFIRSVVSRLQSGKLNFGDDFQILFLSPQFDGVPEKYFAVRSKNLGRLYKSAGIFGTVYRAWKKTSVMARADAIVYAGGSLFCDPSPYRIYLERIMIKAEIRFHAIGISVGPFSSKENSEDVRQHLNLFSSISVRDVRSSQYLTDIDIHSSYAPDIVYALPMPKESAHARPSLLPRILIVPCPLGPESGKQQREFYRALFARVVEFGWTADFCSFQKGDFGGDFSDLVNRSQLIQYEGDFSGFRVQLESYDYIFTSRLHGAVIATMIDKPFYLFQHHIKSTDFLSGLSWPYKNRLTEHEILNDVPVLLETAAPPIDVAKMCLNASDSIDRALLEIFAH